MRAPRGLILVALVLGLVAGRARGDACTPNPCYHGGTCTAGATATDFTCACATTFKGIDCRLQEITDKITIYRPGVECTPVTCMVTLGGACQPDGTCVYSNGYQPLLHYPVAMATNYCEVIGPYGCSGAIGPPGAALAHIKAILINGSSPEDPPFGDVSDSTIVGVTANPPLMVGNSGVGKSLLTGEFVSTSSQGMVYESGYCYDVKGPTGKRAILVPYDRCAGWCFKDCGGVQTIHP